jgi:hypothetical protein
MFRNLIPRLATSFHVVAPDYPGFGQSSMPSHKDFAYTFENLTNVMEQLVEKLKLGPEGCGDALDTGHFALETHGEEIASRIQGFLRQRKLAFWSVLE